MTNGFKNDRNSKTDFKTVADRGLCIFCSDEYKSSSDAIFSKSSNRAESDAYIDKLKAIIEKQGWGFWAVELKSNQQFIGFVGLHDQPTQFSFSPCVEIGWRFRSAFWGKVMQLKLQMQP
jgi:RimJ/RimL family protein N-acetyltransferase